MYAYCLDMPGATEDIASSVDDAVGSEPVAGLIAHVSGPSRDGWRIIDIWESEEDQQRFQAERLGPAVARVTAGMPGPSAPFDTRSVTGVSRLSRVGLINH
jgi:hypothetical protein